MVGKIKKYTERRPWGKFERFTLNEKTTVKIVTVSPRGELSLQFHRHRSEFWRILKGRAQITIGRKIITAGAGREIFIPRGAQHRIKALGKEIQFLEISFGQFSEKDIVRLADKYGRVRR